jgi:hypothetical protein
MPTNIPPPITFSTDRKLIAASPYPTTWQALKERFVFNEHRAILAARFEAWVADVHGVVEADMIWLGGSFASDKADPADIDAVLFYNYRTFMPQAMQRDAFLTEHACVLSPTGAKRSYSVDGATIAWSLPLTRLVALSARWTMILSNGPDDSKRAFYGLPAASVLDCSKNP